MNARFDEVCGATACQTGWRSQFARPRGVLGWLAGHILAVKNRRRSAWVRSLLDVRPGEHILEIGFGPGVDVLRVSELVEHGFVAGVDPSREMVRQATRRNALMVEAGLVELLCASAERIPYPANSFDKVFAVNSLQFCGDTARALREVRRALKPGGALTVVVQPRLPGATEKNVDQADAALQAALREAGFCSLRRERKLMKPVSCVSVQALKPVEPNQPWEGRERVLAGQSRTPISYENLEFDRASKFF